jgi:predicted Zn-ribbon and HTH transcriptional regulator
MPRKKQMIDISNLEECPECRASWIDRMLTPDEIKSGFWSPDTKFFSKLIGVYDHDKDITVMWRCPQCNTNWDRFTGKKIKA